MSIDIKLLGNPSLIIDGKEIVFPYKKAEALFYYLAVTKKESRDKLSWLLWGDKSDNDAKKNLRNALYIIKQTIPEDCICNDKRTTIAINTDKEMKIDVDYLIKSPCDIDEKYGEEFLRGFSLREAEEFEDWLEDRRNFYSHLYIESIEKIIRKAVRSKDFMTAEHYLKLLIKKDEYNEEAYRKLIEIYKDNGRISRGVQLYEQLAKRLKDELGIKPDPYTQDLFKQLCDLREKPKVSSKSSGRFYGRSSELDIIGSRFASIMNNHGPGCVLISGEAGVGKTALALNFIESIDTDNIIVLKTECFQAVEDYTLQPWNTILEQLARIVDIELLDMAPVKKQILSCFFPSLLEKYSSGDVSFLMSSENFKFQYAAEIVSELFVKVSEEKRILILFEDLQWCDRKSMELLTRLLTKIKNCPLMIIGTCRQEWEKKIERYMSPLEKINLLTRLTLDRFSKEDIKCMCSSILPEFNYDSALVDEIYNETEGNAFFLVETINLLREGRDINSLSLRMQGVLESRISSVSNKALMIMNILSVFFDEATYDILLSISGINQSNLVELLEELRDKYIIREFFNHRCELTYRFTHNKLREYVYSRISLSRARILNNKAGLFLEKCHENTPGDSKLITRLIYYFSRGGNPQKQLEYMIKSIKIHLNLSHELFPLINDKKLDDMRNYSASTDLPEKTFGDIERLINTIKSTKGSSKDTREKERTFLVVKSSYLIWRGEYEKGTELLYMMLKSAVKEEDRENTVQGLQQMCYYGIQTDDAGVLEEYSMEMYNLCCRYGLKHGIGTSLRFLGILYIFKKEYAKAEKYLKESIEVFKNMENTSEGYTLSIAAACNFIGDIYSYTAKTLTALEYYEKGIEMCEQKKIYWGLDLLYANAGHGAYDMGDMEKAKKYFESSLRICGMVIQGRGCTIANCYMALICLKKGEYVKSLEYLRTADAQGSKLKKKYWLGLILRVKAEIKLRMKDDMELYKVFGNYLSEKLEYYIEDALYIFESIGNINEVIELKKICQGIDG